MNRAMILLIGLFGFLVSGCYGDTKIEFDVVGTGFNGVKMKDLGISCDSSRTTSSWGGELTVTKQIVGRVKMSGEVYVPKNTVIYCRLSGEGFANLPHIPIYNNSYQSRYFAVTKNARIKVRLHRQAIEVDEEIYDHIVFKKIDHIANKSVKIVASEGRGVASY